jgi:hypothetical protein
VLVRKLLAGTSLGDALEQRLSERLVRDMSDGGMGSIQFCPPEPKKRLYGSTIGEGSFLDEDGTLVSVSLNLDQSGDLFELDMWKVDFSPLLRYPEPGNFKIINPDQRPTVKRKRRHA